MTVSVTMIATRMGEDGDYWEAGTSHDATDGFARYLVQYGWASATFPRAEQSAPVQFISITAAEVAAGNGVEGQSYLVDGVDRVIYAGGEFKWFIDPTKRYADGSLLVDASTRSEQFAITQRGLPITTRNVTETGLLHFGPCALVGVRCLAPGSAGDITIHDSLAASDATKLRFSLAYTGAAANTYYPAVADEPIGMLMDTGCYVTVPASGVYAIDLLVGSAIAGLDGSGMLCVPAYVSATGEPASLIGPSNVVSVKVLAVGSAGNLAIYNDFAATAAKTRFASTAYTSLAANQTIRLGPRGGAMQFDSMYVTMPTSGVVLVNHLPR